MADFLLSKLKKLEVNSDLIKGKYTPDQTLEAIVRVKRSNFVPPKVNLRARIDDEMFTGTMQAKDLPEIEANPDVQSVAVSKKLRTVG